MNNTAKPTGFSSLLNHAFEGENPSFSHAAPIYQSSAFRFDSAEGAAAAFAGEESAFIYTRLDNPNHSLVVKKVAALEGWDLLGGRPLNEIYQMVDGQLYASGMAAISSAVYCCINQGDTLICQQNIYGATNQFLKQLAVKLNLKLVWVQGEDLTAWQQAFLENPQAKLAYAETPANPTLSIVDLSEVANLAHQYQAWLMVDNTFASPYNQRPFNQGADVIIHSTTKYLSGHGVIIGGIVLSRHPEWVSEVLKPHAKLFGATPSPFDAWLTNLGLKTYEIRMHQHNQNAQTVAEWLSSHPKIEAVYYPGLSTHPGYETAKKQMYAFGGMLAFEVKGGLSSGKHLMDHLKMISLVPTLGNCDTIVQHPASMSHVGVPREERLLSGITDGLVRFSTGIENAADLIADLEQALG
ncbi:MAG: methionine gamma-lyase [Anaerolineaceae bacterium]|nr:methionine gamma-lyase [Anaerolineaceae bacterium]